MKIYIHVYIADTFSQDPYSALNPSGSAGARFQGRLEYNFDF